VLTANPGSPSIHAPTYWWYRARSALLERALGAYVGEPGRLLDVGSADGPSVGWLRGRGFRVPLDLDPRGLDAGGVCGSATALPFAERSFDVVAAFDVIEHCADEHRALREIHRVLTPGGRFLMSVPAYQWAWTSFDDANHHHRRYTRARALAAVTSAGFEVQRATYIFGATFPAFAADRLRTRVKERASRPAGRTDAEPVEAEEPQLPEVSSGVERLLLAACRAEERWLGRGNLPFGSSVVVAATKAR